MFFSNLRSELEGFSSSLEGSSEQAKVLKKGLATRQAAQSLGLMVAAGLMILEVSVEDKGFFFSFFVCLWFCFFNL